MYIFALIQDKFVSISVFLKFMIRILNKYSLLLACLLVTIITVAAEGEPPPPVTLNTTSRPPPPGLPIDDRIVFLLIAALLFGFYKIYVFTVKKKRPV